MDLLQQRVAVEHIRVESEDAVKLTTIKTLDKDKHQ